MQKIKNKLNVTELLRPLVLDRINPRHNCARVLERGRDIGAAFKGNRALRRTAAAA